MATTGEWGGLQVRLDIPELRELVDAVNGVFDIIITALDIALSVMNVIKSFVSSLLNPVRAIIKELIKALQNLVFDFRQTGFYVHGDWYLLGDTTRERLKGGYAAYERRMISRLMDRRDLNRPNFPDTTTTLALFLYTGVNLKFVKNLTDFSQFQVLFQLIEGFARFFGFNINGSPLPVPSRLQANFAGGRSRLLPGGSNASAITSLRGSVSRLEGRTSTILQWGLAPSPGSDSEKPTPVVPPHGFLIELSVFPQGLFAGYMEPTPSSTGGVEGGGSEGGAPSYQVGLYEEADTGRPLRIFGGKSSVQIDESVDWDASFDGDRLRQDARPAFFLRDVSSTEFIRTNVFDGPEDGKFYFQRTLYVPHEEVLSQTLVGGVYSYELPSSALPLTAPISPDGVVNFEEARQARTVYVRVLSVSDKVAGVDGFRWDIKPHRNPEDTQVAPANGLTIADRSLASEVIEVTFPDEETDIYMGALRTALAVMLLSRSDVTLPSAVLGGEEPPPGNFQATGLESIARDVLPLVIPNPQDYYSANANPGAFGSDILAKVGLIADVVVSTQGNLPRTLHRARADRYRRLMEWQWSESTAPGARGNESLETTILEALETTQNGASPTMYVAKNTRSLLGYERNPAGSQERSRGLRLNRSYEAAGFGDSTDASETAPIIAAQATGSSFSEEDDGFEAVIAEINTGVSAAWYARELFTPEVYGLAREVLQLAVADASAGRGWVAVRPFLGVGNLSGLQEVADKVKDFLEMLDAGVEGAENLIMQFISMLEQRVREIQELIRRIQSYLAIPLTLEIPDALILPLVVNGTNGIVTGLATAQNKPTDGVDAYAGGLVIVAGGIPAIVQDLLLLLVASQG